MSYTAIWTRRGLCRCAAFFLVLGSMAMAPQAIAALPFELDADATTGNNGGVDWQSFLTIGPGQTGIIADAGGSTVFTGGGSKDILDTSNWAYTTKSTPPKDNITDAYAVAQVSGSGDLLVYAGLDRYSVSGTADAGFWFFQQPIGLQPGGKFGPGKHTEGDLLVVVEYTNGGSVGTVKVFVWHNGGLTLQATGADCLSTSGMLPCGRTNTSPVTVYWPYSGKGGTTKPAAGGFLEIGVNVSAIARAVGNPQPCFTSFLAETRSSATPDAVLKDFVEGSFPVCGVKVGKSCPAAATVNASGTAIHSVFNVPITNTGFGPLSNITLTDTLVDASHVCSITSPISAPFINNSTPVQVASTLSSTPGSNVLNVTVACDTNGGALNSNPFFNSIKVSASTSNVAGAPTVTDSHTVTDDPNHNIKESCSAAISPSVTVTKQCKSVNLVGGSNNPKVCVDISITSTTTEQLTNLDLNDMTIDGTTSLNSQLQAVNPSMSLAPGATVTVPNVCYTPSRPDNSVSGTNVNPESAQYSDKASVDGVGSISKQTLSQSSNGVRPSGGISCKLCPPPQGSP